jgi:hypothetical protein
MSISLFLSAIFSEPKGSDPKVLFHGGCNGCSIQDKYGTSKCSGCCHYKSDWDKPNLNTLDKAKRVWKTRVKILAFIGIAPLGDKTVFHGGCLQCKSQDKHGIRRCLGCQYFDADWNKPDLSIKK